MQLSRHGSLILAQYKFHLTVYSCSPLSPEFTSTVAEVVLRWLTSATSGSTTAEHTEGTWRKLLKYTCWWMHDVSLICRKIQGLFTMHTDLYVNVNEDVWSWWRSTYLGYTAEDYVVKMFKNYLPPHHLFAFQ